MADYYRTTYSSGSRREGRSAVGIIADMVVGVITVAVTLLFIVTLFVPHLDPRNWSEITTLGIVAPFVYAAQALLTLYWIMRWRLWVAVPMILVSLFGVFSLSSFYRMEVRRTYAEPKYDRQALKVMTYNVRSFIGDDGKRNIDSMVAMIKNINPDILCFQEFGFKDAIDTMLKSMYGLPKSLNRSNLSPAIYSRYPIVKAERIDTMKAFLWADIAVKDDTLRVFNLHLHSTTIRKTDSNYIENHEYMNDEGSEEQIKSMVARLTENNKLRAAQVDTITQIIAASPYPVIVCGDFNDTPISYTYHKLSRRMRDTYREQGRGYAHSYRGFFDMLRIDYILCSKNFEVLSYDVIDSWGLQTQKTRRGDTIVVRHYGNQQVLIGEGVREYMDKDELKAMESDSIEISNEVGFSDHYPVMARLLYTKQTN